MQHNLGKVEEPVQPRPEAPHKNCRPKAANGPAHLVKRKTKWTCYCGKTWEVTHRHYGNVCGCGWRLKE